MMASYVYIYIYIYSYLPVSMSTFRSTSMHRTAQFYLDGKLSYTKSASGYSLTEYAGVGWDDDDSAAARAYPAFGQRFSRSVVGTTHLHSAAWKVSLVYELYAVLSRYGYRTDTVCAVSTPLRGT